ncbi:N-acetyltransferase family protein [Yinghuangia sp. YIM S09857]|uniref:GNAT family N-acetyltransferase n=1 Tax=Yinghuangia sp. YIM S09857 TaxID=3436929 RepID=UPI003F535007
MSEISTRWYRPGAIPTAELRGLTDVFEEVSDDFVPPLTSRGSTTQSDLRDRAPEATAPGQDYLTEMLRQDVVVSRHGDRVVGFLSFRSHHQDPRYADLSPCLYVSTVAVRHSHRRHGIARALYRELFGVPASLPAWIVLRTWSTNTGHLELLDRLGFTTVLRLKDARAAGIDTVYLAADRTANADDGTASRTGAPAGGPADTTP